NIIARLPNGEALVGKNMRKSHEDIMDGDKNGWEEAAGVDGIVRIFGFNPAQLPPKDFFLSAGQSKIEAMEPIEAATKRGIFLVLLGLLAAMYLAWIGRRTLELEDANRAKSQFLAKMSHEIRTPVNGVLGMLELVRQTRLDGRQQRYLETAARSAETLLGIINGILDISKIEAGKIEL